MNKESVFEIIKEIFVEVVPSMKTINIQMDDTFKKHGINSIERMEINMLLLEETERDIPRVELLKAGTLGELAIIICEN